MLDPMGTKMIKHILYKGEARKPLNCDSQRWPCLIFVKQLLKNKTKQNKSTSSLLLTLVLESGDQMISLKFILVYIFFQIYAYLFNTQFS